MVYASYRANISEYPHPTPLVLSYTILLRVGRERKVIDQFTAFPETPWREVGKTVRARAKRLGYSTIKWED